MRHESSVWVLENHKIKLIVEKETGWLRSLIYRERNIDLLGGQIGGIKIYDGLKNEWYSDLQTPFRIFSGECDGRKLEFVKKFQAADFSLKVTLSLVEDEIRWIIRSMGFTETSTSSSANVMTDMLRRSSPNPLPRMKMATASPRRIFPGLFQAP